MFIATGAFILTLILGVQSKPGTSPSGPYSGNDGQRQQTIRRVQLPGSRTNTLTVFTSTDYFQSPSLADVQKWKVPYGSGAVGFVRLFVRPEFVLSLEEAPTPPGRVWLYDLVESVGNHNQVCTQLDSTAHLCRLTSDRVAVDERNVTNYSGTNSSAGDGRCHRGDCAPAVVEPAVDPEAGATGSAATAVNHRHGLIGGSRPAAASTRAAGGSCSSARPSVPVAHRTGYTAAGRQLVASGIVCAVNAKRGRFNRTASTAHRHCPDSG